MPICVRAKDPTSRDANIWRGIDVSTDHATLLWSDTKYPVHLDLCADCPPSIEDQAALVLEHYAPFAYKDEDLFDVGYHYFPQIRRHIDQLNSQNIEHGWLKPDGEFIGYADPNDNVFFYPALGDIYHYVEANKWVCVGSEEFYMKGHVITGPQSRTLSLLGFDSRGHRAHIPTFTLGLEAMRQQALLENGEPSTLNPISQEIAFSIMVDIEGALKKARADKVDMAMHSADTFFRATKGNFEDRHLQAMNRMLLKGFGIS